MQSLAFERLKKSFLNDRLSHAYVFYGERGTKKIDLAIKFAQMLYCLDDEKPCLECSNCKTIEARLHQNVIIIEAVGQTIKKEQIVAIINELSKTSQVNGPRVYIINGAEKMTLSSANSLLKLIEEPQNEAYAILLTDNISMTIPTILSRCQVIRCAKQSKQSYIDELSNITNEKEYYNLFYELTNDVNEVKTLIDNGFNKMIFAVKTVLKGIINKEAVLDFDNQIDYLCQDKENFQLFMQILFLVYLDAIYMNQKSDKITNDYAIEEINELAKYKLTTLKQSINKIRDCIEKLRFSVNQMYAVRETIIELEMRC